MDQAPQPKSWAERSGVIEEPNLLYPGRGASGCRRAGQVDADSTRRVQRCPALETTIHQWGWKHWTDQAFNGARPVREYTSTYATAGRRRRYGVCDAWDLFVGPALDAATGELIRKYAGTEKAFEIVCYDGVLVWQSTGHLTSRASNRTSPLWPWMRKAATCCGKAKATRGLRKSR